MLKQGGTTANGNVGSKKGVGRNHTCKHCGRRYGMQWAKDKHEKKCEQYKNSKKQK